MEEDERVRRERHNSSKYRKLYTELLLQHQGIIQAAQKQEHSDEAQRIQSVIESEKKALLIGVLSGVTLFSTLRVLPRYLIRRFGGPEKLQAVQQADEQAKKEGYYAYQRIFAFVIEGSFSFWIANRAYQYQSKHSHGAYETLAKVPLCSGRSVISESLCDDWVNITTRQIPQTFWQNLKLKEGGLHDERSWRAILEFSINCQRRSRFEAKLKQAKGYSNDPEDDHHLSLPTKVPDNGDISLEEAQRLVKDHPI